MENKTTHWIRLSEIKQYYLASLDNNLELSFMFGKEEFDKLNYKPEQPTLQGLIKFCKEYNIPGWKSAILGKNNNLLKITNG